MSIAALPRTGGQTPSRAVELPTTSFIRRAREAARAREGDARPKPIRAYPVTSQIIYSDEEREFLTAVDNYKREQNKRFPTYTEVFAILTKRLGYAKLR